MSRTLDIVTRARAGQRPVLLCEAIPFASFLGLEPLLDSDGALMFRLPFSEHLVGNPGVPALHGGTLSSLVETVAVMKAFWDGAVGQRYRAITLTVDFLRPAGLADVWARGTFLRVGRRVVAVEVRVWQGEERLVARGRAHLMVVG
ncbi:MAG: hypothetical protein ACI8RZ_007046 [Myxococcota bacterium]|jgi:uncharacterized protein (TIGR00369 family)